MKAEGAKLAAFSEPARIWFLENFAVPTPVQEQGWKQIAEGSHSLLVAPTGSGKTLAAFFWAIDRCSRPDPGEPATSGASAPGTKILYISPLKALAVDVERNLRAPLVGILRTAERLGQTATPLRIDLGPPRPALLVSAALPLASALGQPLEHGLTPRPLR